MSGEVTAGGSDLPASGEAADRALLQRRALITAGSAAGLGIVALTLPSAQAAASSGLLSPSGFLDAPTDFAGTGGDGFVTLSWTPVAGADGYQVQYRADGDATFASYLDVTDGAAGGVSVSDLTNDVAYDFRVVAYQGSAVSTPAGPIEVTPVLTAPGIPASVSAGPAGTGELVVAWARGSDGGTPTLYRIQYKASTDSTWLESGTTSSLSTTIASLTNDTSYDVRVRAENNAGDSAYSEPVSATPVAPIVETVAAREPQPPVLGVVTHPTSLVVLTDRETTPGFTYSFRQGSSGDYTPVTFDGASQQLATFTLASVPTSETTYFVQKTNGVTTETSSFTSSQVIRSATPGQVLQLSNATTNDTYVGSLTAYARGGGAGRGGADNSTFKSDVLGGLPSPPGEVIATIPFARSEVLVVGVGAAGLDGSADVRGTGGGAGGTNVFPLYRGGPGGVAGWLSNTDSGGGGGGGAASVIFRGTSLANATPVVIAGGAAGGGGGNAETPQGVEGSSDAVGRPGFINQTTGWNGDAGGPNDAPGGGGGGGGATGGRGGTVAFVSNRWRTTDPAGRGSNAVASGVVTTVNGVSASADRNENQAGGVTLTYLEVSAITSV